MAGLEHQGVFAMPCYFDPVSFTTASGHYHTYSSPLSQIFPALPLPDCQHSANCQPNCHKPTSPPTNSPPCNPATAFIIPQYQMTETCHAFRGMCQNRPALIFCQLFHRSTVPTMPWYRHVSAVSPNCSAMPPFRVLSFHGVMK